MGIIYKGLNSTLIMVVVEAVACRILLHPITQVGASTAAATLSWVALITHPVPLGAIQAVITQCHAMKTPQPPLPWVSTRNLHLKMQSKTTYSLQIQEGGSCTKLNATFDPFSLWINLFSLG